MRAEPSAASYKHEPLPDSSTYIRLLEIESLDSDGHSNCLLTAWPVAEAPDYYAISYVPASKSSSCFILIRHCLSYTWGSPTPSYPILINGCVFAAGQNCAFALKQAYSSKASRYFWLDALCIDQDTTKEKSHQVGMMGQIYQRSRHVLACVGPHTEDSTSLFRAIDKNESLLAEIHRATLGSAIENSGYWVMPNPIRKIPQLAVNCLSTVSPLQRKELAIAFIAFMNRPYFSRVWILQELHLAPTASLCCGMDIRSFDHLSAVNSLIDLWVYASKHISSLSDFSSAVADGSSPPPDPVHRQKSHITLRNSFRNIEPQRGCITLASGRRRHHRLADVLEAIQSFQCTDVRDKLFGVLALIEWGDGEPTVPDYGKNNYEVAIEVLRLYLENPVTRPILGLAVDWTRLLWETFQVNVEAQAVQQAMTKRFASQSMPLNNSPLPHAGSSNPTSFDQFSPSLRYPSTYTYVPVLDYGVTTWHQNCSGRPREMWCGIQLRDTRSAKPETSIPGDSALRYLYCSAPESIRRPDNKRPYVEILDHMQRVFGYAPVETRPSDWILFSRQGFMIEGSSTMVVVRSVSDGRHNHTMIGLASKNCAYKETVLSLLEWRSFGAYWNAEDLFLVGYMGRNRSICSDIGEKTPG